MLWPDRQVGVTGVGFLVAFLAVICLAGCGEPGGSEPSVATDGRQPGIQPPPTDDRGGVSTALAVRRIEHSAPPARDLRDDDWFEDVTEHSGVHFTYRNGREAGACTMVETIGGGVALLDYDVDGDLDLFLTGGGTIDLQARTLDGLPPALFRNDGQGAFTDVTDGSGLDLPTDYSHGAFAGDFDRDGWPDLFVTYYGQSRLFRNQRNGTFADHTETSGLRMEKWSSAAAWADYDRDGWLDLYVVGYLDWDAGRDMDMWCGDRTAQVRDVCGPAPFAGAQDRLFRNSGTGRFNDVTTAAGLRNDGKGLGVVAADLNGDDWIDFYVANDTTENHLYLGGPQLPLREAGLESAVATDDIGKNQGSMGADVGDADGNGLPDLWVTNFQMEDNSLYLGLGGGAFTHATRSAGLGGQSRLMVGWGAGFADFDGDGWQDLFVCNGHVWYSTGASPFLQPSFVYRNEGAGRFTDSTAQAGPYFSTVHAARGAAVGDLDNDGGMDNVITHLNEPVVILRNRRPARNWVRVQLRGDTVNRDAVGATVSLEQEGRPRTQWRRGGGGYLSSSDPRLLFALPDPEAVAMTVRWPGGKVERFTGLSSRCTHELIEGHGQTP